MADAPPNAPNAAVIRPYDPKDEKFAKFTLGKAAFEGLAYANHAVYTHPTTLALWAALSSAMVQLMHWWPEPARGLIGYMRPIPAFGCVLVLILVSVDWIQRTPFEALGQAALRHPDLADLGRYYARAPASGLWTLHLGERFVGLVGLDASADASFAAPESASRAEPATPPAAVLRHLYVEEQYRAARAQDDLLAHALRTAFGTPGGPASVRARTTGVQGYVEDALRRAGFVSDERAEGWAGTVGLLKWRKREWTLQKTEWESNR